MASVPENPLASNGISPEQEKQPAEEKAETESAYSGGVPIAAVAADDADDGAKKSVRISKRALMRCCR